MTSLDVIEESDEKLIEVEGIGSKRVDIIRKAWSDQKDIREVMLFLQGNGVSSAYAAKIFKQYRSQSIDVVKENPYRLAMDIFGIGFVTADKIASNAQSSSRTSRITWRSLVRSYGFSTKPLAPNSTASFSVPPEV